MCTRCAIVYGAHVYPPYTCKNVELSLNFASVFIELKCKNACHVRSDIVTFCLKGICVCNVSFLRNRGPFLQWEKTFFFCIISVESKHSKWIPTKWSNILVSVVVIYAEKNEINFFFIKFWKRTLLVNHFL